MIFKQIRAQTDKKLDRFRPTSMERTVGLYCYNSKFSAAVI